MKYVMGIDNGSQSTKVAIYDIDGNEICFGSYKLKDTYTPEPGVVLHPDDDLWDSVLGAMKYCLKNFNGNKRDIEAIGLCTIRCCRALLKGDGSLAYPVLSWMDARLAKPYVHTDDTVKFVTSTSGYLANRLTGQFKDTASNLEVYWPIDWNTLEWFEEESKIAEMGLKKEMLFELVKPGEAFGAIRKELATELGLDENITVVATANDKAVEVLGAGIKEESTIMISLGTFISSMLYRESYFENAQTFFPTLACIPHKYVYESTGIRRGMWTVSWFKKIIGEELTIGANMLNISEEDYLNLKSKDVPAGSDGLITILDWLASPSIPYRKGIMIGFDQRHTKFHIYRSILEAIAYNIKNNIDDMTNEIGATLKEIVVIGGGSKSDLIMQIIADLFGLKTIRRVGNSSACLGAAICACKYLGYYNSFDEAVDKMVKTKEVFTPNADLFDTYNAINEKIVKVARNYTDEILKISYPIFK